MSTENNSADTAAATAPTSSQASAAPAAPTTTAAPTAPTTTTRGPRRPRTGPIVWGAIVLAVCLYSAATLVAPGAVDGTTFLIVSVIGLGMLLLAVAIAVMIRGSRRP